MIGFINDHRSEFWGRADLPSSSDRPATFYEHLAIARDPDRASDRAKRDVALRREGFDAAPLSSM